MKAIDPRTSMQETFHWEHQIFDISTLLADLELGRVKSYIKSTLCRDDIERLRAFLVGEAHPGVPADLVRQHRIQVDLTYAETLALADLDRPIVMLHVGHNAGMIELHSLGPGANYVLADGNHRVIRAYQLQCQVLPFVVIQKDVALDYLIAPDDTEY